MQESSSEYECPIVGLGTSAGGLETLFIILETLEMPLDFSVVILQHSSANHESLLPMLLARHSDLPVQQLQDGERPLPNRIYVIPPARFVDFRKGCFHISGEATNRTPIDYFFRSLASALKTDCAGVVLSGAGSDGTVGLKAIQESGGLTVAQDPNTALCPSMPLSAISQRAADLVLKPEEILPRLAAHFRTPISFHTLEKLDEFLPSILQLVRSQTGKDFRSYKTSTLERRIRHRMGVCRVATGKAYLGYLHQQPKEVELLAGEFLVGVTSFFRDPEAFQSLDEHAFPALLANRAPEDPVRIWVPGCSTGEEAYSIAIGLSEYLERKELTEQQFTVFATDLDAEAIDVARSACYPQGVALDISPQLLRKYFSQSGDQFEVASFLRERLTFAVHSVFKDPPFSRMDLVSCRNLLIYLQPSLQDQVLSLLHYSLRVGGFLLLGHSEGAGRFLEHFQCVDRRWKLFRKLQRLGRSQALRTLPSYEGVPSLRPRVPRPVLRTSVEKTLLEEFCPVAVVTDPRGQIHYIHGDSERFLVPPRGEVDFSLLRMAREELKAPLMSLLAAAMRDHNPRRTQATLDDVPTCKVELEIRPFRHAEGSPSDLMLILFRLQGESLPPQESAVEGDRSRVRTLEKELDATRSYLRTTIEKLETTNEEFETLNEELQSANEELHSTNEELETSREELLSVNEELDAVNKELNEQVETGKRESLEAANFLAGMDLAFIHVDNDARIRRYTPAAARVIHLLTSDIGRPLHDLATHLDLGEESLARLVLSVIQTLSATTKEVRSSEGQWYSLRVKPHRTPENVIDGAILSFLNITSQKEESERLLIAAKTAENSPGSLMMLNLAGNVVYRTPDAPCKLGDQADFWPLYQEKAGGDGPWHFVSRRLDGHGGLARRDIAVRPVPDSTGQTVGLVASVQVSEESESLFEVMGGHLLFLDAQGHIIRASLELCEVLGLTQESIAGKNWLENFVLSSDLDRARPFFLMARIPGDTCEAQILSPAGPLLFRWRALVLAEVSPGQNGRILAGENISELHRARSSIARSRGLMRVFRIFNESVNKGESKDVILRTVCEALVKEARYVRAWVGFVTMDQETTMDPIVASGHQVRVSSAAILLGGVLADKESGPRPFVHQNPDLGLVTIVLPLALEGSLGLLELDSDWSAFLEDEVEALRQLSASLGELLNSIGSRRQ